MDHLSKLISWPPLTADRLAGPAHRQRAFTFVELLVVLAISSIVLTMALESLTIMTGQLTQLEHSAEADDEAKLLNEYLTASFMSVGGGFVRPWSALQVENNYRGSGSDRITFAELVSNPLQCTLLSLSGADATLDASTGCCLTQEFVKRQALIISGASDAGAHWESKYIESIDPSSCHATLSPGYGVALNVAPSSQTVYAEGVLAVVSLRVLWLNVESDELMVDEDFDLDGEMDSRVVADRVIDLQAALGYDVSPWDWRVSDSASNTDEWLYNVPGDTFARDDGQGLANAAREDLRMIRFGICVGSPASSPQSSYWVALLDGPIRQRMGWMLRGVTGVTGLRNYDIMR